METPRFDVTAVHFSLSSDPQKETVKLGKGSHKQTRNRRKEERIGGKRQI